MKIKNFKNLRDYVEKHIEDTLKKEVFETIKETQLEHIRTDVFSVYRPSVYERREYDGIDDSNNIVIEYIKDGTLKILNITEFNPDYNTKNFGLGLAKLIEQGHTRSGYYYDYPKKDKKFTEPRPFIKNTKKDLSSNKQHLVALKEGLLKAGIKTK